MRIVHMPLAHEAAPMTNPSLGETTVTEPGANPAGAAAWVAEVGAGDRDGAIVGDGAGCGELGDPDACAIDAGEPLATLGW
jgi:hypothetical protein